MSNFAGAELLHEPPLVPDQHDHEYIEDREYDQAKGVRVGKAIELIDDESGHHQQRGRVRPHSVSEQAYY